MATNLHRVHQNFLWRLSQITPTATDGNPKARFFEIDLLRVDPEESSGIMRGVTVTWNSSEDDVGYSDRYARLADHTFTLEAYYSTKLKHNTLHQLILQDRHDITKQLRDSSKWVGYNDDNSSTDIGLKGRYRIEDELDTDLASTWIFRQRWRCTVDESEE